MREINKDFYDNLPSMVCQQLDNIFIPKFREEKWFNEAWEEYRQHIKNNNMDDMKMPYYIFKKYINPELLTN